MALTWLAPDRSVLSVAFMSQRKWRFVGNTAQLDRVDNLLTHTGAVVITSHGEPVAVLIRASQWSGLERLLVADAAALLQTQPW